MNGVEVIRAVSLGELPHGYFGRRGGMSAGDLAGLNVGYGSKDDRSAIDENRRRAIAALLPDADLATVHQVHSADVVRVDRAWPRGERPRADAMVTDRPGLLLGILTADCAPVLFADRGAGVVGAAHAGWRGALAGVTNSTIAAMERLGARRDNIHAAVGPCIGQSSYEVDEDFRAASSSMIATTGGSSSAAPQASRTSTWRATSSTDSSPSGSARSRAWTSTLMPTPLASTATAARPIAAKRIMGGSSRHRLA